MNNWIIDKINTRAEYCATGGWTASAKAMLSAPRFRIDNVVEYFFANSDQETWSPSEDFPTPRLPFEHLWLESDRPSKIKSSGVESNWGKLRPTSWAAFVSAIPKAKVQTASPAFDGVDLSNCGSFLALTLWTEWNSSNLAYPVKWLLPLTAEHEFAHLKANAQVPGTTDPVFEPFAAHSNLGGLGERLQDLNVLHDLNKTMKPFRDSCLLALSFLNCKNTVVSEHEAPRAMRRRGAREDRPVTWRYHMLNIDALQHSLW